MTDFFPLQLLLATFAGWANRHRAQVIEYLVEENRVRKEQLRGKRLRLTDDQRRRLAAKGKTSVVVFSLASRRSSHRTRSCAGTIDSSR